MRCDRAECLSEASTGSITEELAKQKARGGVGPTVLIERPHLSVIKISFPDVFSIDRDRSNFLNRYNNPKI